MGKARARFSGKTPFSENEPVKELTAENISVLLTILESVLVSFDYGDYLPSMRRSIWSVLSQGYPKSAWTPVRDLAASGPGYARVWQDLPSVKKRLRGHKRHV